MSFKKIFTTGRDLEALLSLAEGSRRILEFGTAYGMTTLALARAFPDVEVRTVDVLGREVLDTLTQQDDVMPPGEIGGAFRDAPEAARIAQVLIDPRQPYDLDAIAPDGWSCDFAFADSLHTREGVTRDTAAAAAIMLRNGRGAIVWDDCHLLGVPHLIAKLKDLGVVHFDGTRLCYLWCGESELREVLRRCEG